MRRVTAFLVVLICLSSVARAEITLGFTVTDLPERQGFFQLQDPPPAPPSAGGSQEIRVEVGQTRRINVFMMDIGASTIISDAGLAGAGYQASFNTGNGQVVGQLSVGGDSYYNPQVLDPVNGPFAVAPLDIFRLGDAPSFNNDTGVVRAGGFVDLTDPRVEKLPLDQGGDQIRFDYYGKGTGAAFVGFFDFEVTGEGATTFTFSDPFPEATAADVVDAPIANPPNGGGGRVLDGLVYDQPGFRSSATLTLTTIAVVPEPGSMFALAVVAGGVLVRRRRR